MATIGGNIMQRTRCTYFRDVTAACNKREPGSGCAALHGVQPQPRHPRHLRRTAWPPIPSDVAVAFAALEARCTCWARTGRAESPSPTSCCGRAAPLNREQALRKGELITAVEIPALPRPLKSGYLKVRDRQSYEFALDVGGRGAAHTRRRHPQGQGRRRRRGHRALEAARRRAATSSVNAPRPALGRRPPPRRRTAPVPCTHNRFKAELLKRTVERQLRAVGGTK